MRDTRPLHRGKLARALRWSSIALIGGLMLLEIGARVVTRECANGMPRIGRVPLLPFRPTAAMIEQHLARNAGSTYIVQDSELGWSIGPEGEANLIDGEPLYQSNREGLRAPRDRVYGVETTAGKIRIVTVGDSFTHCDEVNGSQTWQQQLESLRPELEVLNLGVPGFGTDQALMRWRRDGRRFHSQLVVLGIWPENMCRNLSLFRYYLVPSEGFGCKPRMIVRSGALSVINTPVVGREELIATLTDPEAHPLLAQDHWYRGSEARASLPRVSRIYQLAESVLCMHRRRQERMRLYSRQDPAAIDITVAIAEQFVRDVRAAGSTPLVLLIPMRDLLDMHADTQPFPLVEALRERGIEVLDLGSVMQRAVHERGAQTIYTGAGHHSPEGNRVVAEALAEQLQPWVELAQR